MLKGAWIETKTDRRDKDKSRENADKENKYSQIEYNKRWQEVWEANGCNRKRVRMKALVRIEEGKEKTGGCWKG